MKQWIFILLCWMALAGWAKELSFQETADLCREGEKFFAEGNELANTNYSEAMNCWQKAAARLERASSEGNAHNGPIFYNLGNIYFRMGNIGLAIYNYRRAQLYMPNDENLVKNLSFARRSCQDYIPEMERTKVLKTLFFWHFDFSLWLREIVFVVCFCSFWTIMAIRLKWAFSWTPYGAWGSGLLALALAVSVAVTLYNRTYHQNGVILSPEVIAYAGNSTSYAKAFEKPLHAGTELSVLEQRGNWLEIRLANGAVAWLPVDAVKIIEQ